MSRLVVYIVAVALMLKVGTAAPAESAQGSNNLNTFMNITTAEAFKQLWKGFRAVDYLVVSAYTCIICLCDTCIVHVYYRLIYM